VSTFFHQDQLVGVIGGRYVLSGGGFVDDGIGGALFQRMGGEAVCR